MKVLKPVVALSAVALSTAVWAKTPRFPTPETVSDEMAQTVARPEDPIWANAPASLAEWKDTVANYIKTISATALETAKARVNRTSKLVPALFVRMNTSTATS